MTEATLRQQAQAHFAKNEYEEAERLYTRLLEEQTEDELWKVWTNRSLCWMRLEVRKNKQNYLLEQRGGAGGDRNRLQPK